MKGNTSLEDEGGQWLVVLRERSERRLQKILVMGVNNPAIGGVKELMEREIKRINAH